MAAVAAGIYENEYIKEHGVWQIKLLHYNLLGQANHDEGWARSGVHLSAFTKTYPADPHGPDELVASMPKTWPETDVVPFHYPHPVTVATPAPAGRCERCCRSSRGLAG